MQPELIYADIKHLNRYELMTGRHETFVTNYTRIVALDVDVRLGKVFFSDVADNKLHVTYFEHHAAGSKVCLLGLFLGNPQLYSESNL